MQKKERYNVAIAGATGAVGNEMLSILEERKFPVAELRLLASSRSIGKRLEFFGKEYPVSPERAKAYLAEGHFAPGSMKPKIEAAVDFLESGGQRVIITQPHLLEAALRGNNGTHIVP